jgi:hypothetical protein
MLNEWKTRTIVYVQLQIMKNDDQFHTTMIDSSSRPIESWRSHIGPKQLVPEEREEQQHSRQPALQGHRWSYPEGNRG